MQRFSELTTVELATMTEDAFNRITDVEAAHAGFLRVTDDEYAALKASEPVSLKSIRGDPRYHIQVTHPAEYNPTSIGIAFASEQDCQAAIAGLSSHVGYTKGGDSTWSPAVYAAGQCTFGVIVRYSPDEVQSVRQKQIEDANKAAWTEYRQRENELKTREQNYTKFVEGLQQKRWEAMQNERDREAVRARFSKLNAIIGDRSKTLGVMTASPENFEPSFILETLGA